MIDPSAAWTKPCGVVHPRVHGDDAEGAADAGDHDRHPGPEVLPAVDPLPAVDVDRDEDRLGEEEDALDREAGPEDLAPLLHEGGPEQAELEGEHRAGHGADREEHGGGLRPLAGQIERPGSLCLRPAVFGDEHHRRQRDTDAGEDDVEAERERHLLAGGEQIVGGEREAGPALR